MTNNNQHLDGKAIKTYETTCPNCSISPVMCKCCGEVLSDLPPSQVIGKSAEDIEQWYHNWMADHGKSGEVATINEIDMLKDFAARFASKPVEDTQVSGKTAEGNYVYEILHGMFPAHPPQKTYKDVIYGLKSAMIFANNLPHGASLTGQLVDIACLIWDYENYRLQNDTHPRPATQVEGVEQMAEALKITLEALKDLVRQLPNDESLADYRLDFAELAEQKATSALSSYTSRPAADTDKVEDAVGLIQKQIDRLELHDEILLNTICQDLRKAVKILKP